MAGVTDKAFRSLCLEQGASLTYTEMISAKGLSYANKKTQHLLETAPKEKQVAVQIFGHEAKVLAYQASWIEQQMGDTIAFIDVNMGCPARKITAKGDGGALMKDYRLASSIISAISQAVQLPVTAKMRLGFEIGDNQSLMFAKALEQAGASALAVHGRYVKQLYHGCADWNSIAEIKQNVAIPIVGNGDIKSGEDAFLLMKQTACDAVMIGRAAQGNPWIFAQAKAALEQLPPPAFPSFEARIEMAKRHAKLLSEVSDYGLVRMRKHAMWYLKGLPFATDTRRDITECVTLDDFYRVLDGLASRLRKGQPHV